MSEFDDLRGFTVAEVANMAMWRERARNEVACSVPDCKPIGEPCFGNGDVHWVRVVTMLLGRKKQS